MANDPELDSIMGTDGEGLSADLYDDFDDDLGEPEPPAPMPSIRSRRPIAHHNAARGMHASPLFQQANEFPTATQLEVYKMEEGRPYSLGHIGLNATQSEFINKYHRSCPGQFVLRPVDSLGSTLGDEFTLNIHETHPALQQKIEPEPNGTRVEPAGSTVAIELLREELRSVRAQHARMLEQLEDERKTIAEERSEVAAERVAMASQAANAVSNQHQQQMAYQNEQANQMITTLTSVFQANMQQQQQMMQMQNQAHEQNMERMRAQDAEDRHRREEYAEREREKARREAKEKRTDAELAMQRERDYHLRLREMEKASSGMGAMKKMLGDFGMTPKDVLEKVLDSGSGTEPGMGSAIVGAVADVAKSFAANAAEASKAQAAVQQRQIEVAALLQAQQNQPEYEDADEDEYEMQALPEFEDAPEEPAQGTPADILAHFRSDPEPAAPQPPALEMTMQDQKKARISARKLVKQMKQSQPDDWTSIIAGEIAVSPSLVQYITAVTIRQTLLEAGADPDFAQLVIQEIDKSGIVPAHIPRG